MTDKLVQSAAHGDLDTVTNLSKIQNNAPQNSFYTTPYSASSRILDENKDAAVKYMKISKEGDE